MDKARILLISITEYCVNFIVKHCTVRNVHVAAIDLSSSHDYIALRVKLAFNREDLLGCFQSTQHFVIHSAQKPGCWTINDSVLM